MVRTFGQLNKISFEEIFENRLNVRNDQYGTIYVATGEELNDAGRIECFVFTIHLIWILYQL